MMRELKEIEAVLASLASRPRFLDPLFDPQIAEGAHKCFRNADALLGDARTLASERPARALSLTILALEELGKIPVLFDLSTRDSVERWKNFWNKEFSRHSFKQAEIGGYGGWLAASGKGPYQLQITAPILGALDRLKQWGFYVDCHEGRFQSPCEFGAEHRIVLDYLFSATEERADSFAQFHATREQSEWFLAQCRKGTGGWPPRFESQEELRGVVLSLASRFSQANPPAYPSFYDACDQLGVPPGGSSMGKTLASLQTTLEARSKCPGLPRSATRAFTMYKLVLGYLTRNEGGDPGKDGSDA
jgi:AbiV family abortive infection protein